MPRIICGDVPAVVEARGEEHVTPMAGSVVMAVARTASAMAKGTVARAIGGAKCTAVGVKEIAETKAIITCFEYDLGHNTQDKLAMSNAPEELSTAKRLRLLERRAEELKQQ